MSLVSAAAKLRVGNRPAGKTGEDDRGREPGGPANQSNRQSIITEYLK